ncbi:hypothetical protein [Cryobacterium psychrophilum]|uniref:Uncharacterized protein n=1 Tax=Cryobacterium psychrophilum TaxID=41988 RepID=A0A4Y8KTC2_9MICO|nr:hypothetical protein [Cryobacterium psychrophilum]TDW31009.1 hypothetical protein EDD25_2797 [Cryobacterium psychrophilum]TFD80867.1 hypothetical protein E3T53_04385 [Cryobacterium psychrophilum]
MRTREERKADYDRRNVEIKAKYDAQTVARKAKEAAFKERQAAAKAARVEAAKPPEIVPMTEEQKRIHNQLALGMSSSSLADTMKSPIALLLLPTTISMMRKERKIAKRMRDAEQ